MVTRGVWLKAWREVEARAPLLPASIRHIAVDTTAARNLLPGYLDAN